MASKQKLSPKAAAAKAARDLAFAKTPERRKKKADNQRRRKKRKEAGFAVKGMDYDHGTGRWVTVAQNRGNFGKGTKSEGGAA